MRSRAIGVKIIARETVAPSGQAVTAKCYGGDVAGKLKGKQKQA
jgi:translation elongation factor EF-4